MNPASCSALIRISQRYIYATVPARRFSTCSILAMAPKRKAAATNGNHSASSHSTKSTTKKQKTNGASSTSEPLINHKFYPKEMSNRRCAQYINGEIPRPIALLEDKLSSTQQRRSGIKPGRAVLHWYKRDLRLFDNRGLAAAAKLAHDSKVPLICLFIVSPEDYEAHVTSAARVDFELRTLEIMKSDFSKLDIPLVVETIEKRTEISDYILDFCQKHSIKNVFCNIEYEVDELRRETKLIDECLANGIAFNPVHDDVVVTPGSLESGSGNQYAVYSPWYRSWVKYIHKHENLLEASPKPGKNPAEARKSFKELFDVKIPKAPANKELTKEEQQRFREIWPAGEHEAMERLQKFLKQTIAGYAASRNIPSESGVSMLSVHHSTGTLAARTSVRMAREANSSKALDGGKEGISTWISEVAWRDFYKHVLCNWPFVCMNKPFKYEFANLKWDYNDEWFEAWCEGKTGFPIVDAAMRQLKEMAYMHNRCRMIVASFLSKDLLLDWRKGEKHFMLNLIDGDFASNSGGWGFSASVGVDPQPYFRIFNPTLQSEKFDPNGEYIRQWVPELKGIKGKAIHDPYARGEGNAAEKAGYPKPVVVHKERREEALSRYKAISAKS